MTKQKPKRKANGQFAKSPKDHTKYSVKTIAQIWNEAAKVKQHQFTFEVKSGFNRIYIDGLPHAMWPCGKFLLNSGKLATNHYFITITHEGDILELEYDESNARGKWVKVLELIKQNI